MASNPEGRWFGFRLDAASMLIVEKKSIPEHLSSLECLDVPASVDSIMRELEDSGEVAKQQSMFLLFAVLLYSMGQCYNQVYKPHLHYES